MREFSGSAVDVIEAVCQVGDADAETQHFALRAALCSSKEEWDLFEQLFTTRPCAKRSVPPLTGPDFSLLRWSSSAAQANGDTKATAGAGLEEHLRKADFSCVPAQQQEDLEHLAHRLLRRTSYRLSRRLKIASRKDRVDLRRTIQRSVSRGGEPLDLRYRGRKRQEARLVLLLDVSGSMNLYSLILLRFAHALQKNFRRAETYLFSTRLVNVTGTLRSRSLAGAWRAMAEVPAGWSSGTKIGESLRDFNRSHGKYALRRDTLVIVMSDGWDTGDPDVLASELRAVKRRVRKLVWLNPLLGLEGYQPLTRGMAAALPYIDVFAPAHNLESLLDLERHLCSTNS